MYSQKCLPHHVTSRNLVKRSREWFAKYHTKVKFERNDPFPGERNAAKAEAAALVELGQQIASKEKKQRGEGLVQGRDVV